ncbi:aminopeptidase N [Mariniluteicoccus endophyticus]
MFPANITRSEARTRSGLVRTESYDLHVDLSGRDLEGAPLARPTENFVTRSTIRFSSADGVTFVDCIADEVLAAEIDGAPVDTSSFNGERFGLPLTAGDHTLVVTALHRFSRSGQGLHRFVDPADDRVYTYTQFEAADARRVYANFEQPDLKATFRWTVVAPESWTVVSNSASVEPSPAGDGFGRWEFAPTQRISTYITAIVAGEYARVPGEITSVGGKVPASVLCRASLVDHLDAERILDITDKGFAVFEEAFGVAYPFGTYDQAFVPEYNMGAMENAGCITFRDDLVFRSRATAAQYENRDNTILHELAHMWFGDLVTMRWWDDLWLKESFAEWASHFAQSEIYPDPSHAWASFCNARKTWAYRADQLPSTHPIAADMVDLEAVELNFDGITYAKGASTLRQLVAFVGRDAFLAGAKAYFADHAYGNTELGDLLGALEKASGRDLSGWSGQWLESTGVNTLRAEVETDDHGNITAFTIRQSAPADHPTLRDHRVAVGLYDIVDDRVTRVHRLEVDVTGELTQVRDLIGKQQPDLILVNDDDLTFAKIRLDERSRATAIDHIHQIDDELARALVWGAAWDMCRDGELPVADYLELALRGLGSESDQTAVSRVLGQVMLATGRFVPREKVGVLRTRLVAGLAGLLRDAEPGSDHQLAFARALASAVDTDAGVALVRAWLDGEEVPQGLDVDADLRWHLVTSLARNGRLDRAAIDAELECDNTISGAEKAAGARAAMPTEAAKADAWRIATAEGDIPNETHRSLCSQFWQDSQLDVLGEYADRYFDAAEMIAGQKGVWATRGVDLAKTALTYLFPVQADRAWIEKLDAWADEALLNDSTRRIVAEGRDDLLRVLRCQAANA